MFGINLSAAETYRWTDAQGRTLFGDKPPATVNAENIDGKISKSNIDSSAETVQKIVTENNRRQTALTVEQRQHSTQGQDASNQEQHKCASARNQLYTLQGRVTFYDENNQEVKVTEKGREAKAKEMESWIAKNC